MVPARSKAHPLSRSNVVQFDRIIKGSTIVTAADSTIGDIGIIGERISVIGLDLPVEGASVIDAAGKYVIPGCVDVHTHLNMPFAGTFTVDDHETGTIAAAWGGTTTIIDFAIQRRGDHLRNGLDTWHGRRKSSHRLRLPHDHQ